LELPFDHIVSLRAGVCLDSENSVSAKGQIVSSSLVVLFSSSNRGLSLASYLAVIIVATLLTVLAPLLITVSG
jgi:hypothetical protein